MATLNKKEPSKCESKLCCKASASLNKSVQADLQKEDKPLGELINEEDISNKHGDDPSEAGE